MALTPDELATLEALTAKAAQPAEDTPDAAAVAAEVAPEVVDAVADVAQVVAAVVADEVGDAHEGEAHRLAAENADLRARLEDAQRREAEAVALANAAVLTAVVESADEPEPVAEEPPVVDELTEDEPPAEKPHPYFRRIPMPWTKN